ncbi:SE1561 family protein [Paraliobacillus ryukyuensis]|uniref:SE1561 family protein n=1 Tax=Paraliobacillus ryukyuensis TaxID=200904 RepID=UPI0015C44E4E|nr:SE1561 family protein [Paraliobacillus ryukyuensis]
MEQEAKITHLKAQLQTFLDQLDQLDPSKTSIEDIDHLLDIIEKMESALHEKTN